MQEMQEMQETQEAQVWSLGWEDSLEKGMATHSSIRAWTIPWIEEPGELHSMGLQGAGHDWSTNTYLLTLIKEIFEKMSSFPIPERGLNSSMGKALKKNG